MLLDSWLFPDVPHYGKALFMIRHLKWFEGKRTFYIKKTKPAVSDCYMQMKLSCSHYSWGLNLNDLRLSAVLPMTSRYLCRRERTLIIGTTTRGHFEENVNVGRFKVTLWRFVLINKHNSVYILCYSSKHQQQNISASMLAVFFFSAFRWRLDLFLGLIKTTIVHKCNNAKCQVACMLVH